MKSAAARWADRVANIKDYSVRWIVGAALDGYIEELAERLRAGIAAPEEMAFAADVLEGKVKPRRPKQGQPTQRTNEQIAQIYFQFKAAYSNLPEKKIKGEVCDIFGVKPRHVYNVLKALDPERRKQHKQVARYAISAYRGSPAELAHFMFQHKLHKNGVLRASVLAGVAPRDPQTAARGNPRQRMEDESGKTGRQKTGAQVET